MTEGKILSAYDVAVEALKFARDVCVYGEGPDQFLNAADQIHAWLMAKAEFQPVPAETASEPTAFRYFADEPRNEHGEFPQYTYWYRYDPIEKDLTFMVDYDDMRRVQAVNVTEDQLTDHLVDEGLHSVHTNEVPERAR